MGGWTQDALRRIMQTSEKGIAFIKSNEGFAAHVYNDVGKNAIGYGHDIEGDVPAPWAAYGITEAEADTLLRSDLAHRYEPAVNALIPADCTQGQYDALVDFAYNLGVGALRTMVAHGWDQIPIQTLRWNHIGTAENAGLTARRVAEVDLFNS